MLCEWWTFLGEKIWEMTMKAVHRGREVLDKPIERLTCGSCWPEPLTLPCSGTWDLFLCQLTPG